MGMPSMPELLIIFAIIILLFGAKKIPDLAKGIGSGIKNFKKAVKDDDEDTNTASKSNEKKEQINKSQSKEESNTKLDESKKV